MSRQRRNWSPEEKTAVVLEIIREESTLAEISRKYEIAQSVLSSWKAEFLENMATVFDKKGESGFRVYDVPEPDPINRPSWRNFVPGEGMWCAVLARNTCPHARCGVLLREILYNVSAIPDAFSLNPKGIPLGVQ